MSNAPAINRSAQLKPNAPLKIFMVAGEHSGDALGAKLIPQLRAQCPVPIELQGVGGPGIAAEGLTSLYPLEDVAVMGPLAIFKALPRIVRRVYQAVDAAKAFEPDLIVIIDSPEFTHPIAKRLRRAMHHVPIIDYVSPSVWAWRPGRARKMAPYVDHILALLPFEPEAHQRLGGPACTYVGHPLVERRQWLEDLDPSVLQHRIGLSPDRPVLVVLPGSRGSEINRLMEPFGETLALLHAQGFQPQVLLPAVSARREMIEALAKDWVIKPHIIEGEDDKFRAFKIADAALAASGTVTLELAVAGAPMVVAYKVDAVASRLRFLLKVPSVVLANLVLGEEPFPEFLQEDCVPEKLAVAVGDLLSETPALAAQKKALEKIPERLETGAETPSQAAARVVLSYVQPSSSEDV